MTTGQAPSCFHTLIGIDGPVLSIEPAEGHSTPSIDALFETAADAFGPGTIAVALSSASTDGAKGAADILRAGGRVLAVSPDLAEFPILVHDVAKLPGAEVASPQQIAATLGDAMRTIN